MASNLEELKKQVFFDMLSIAGRVFVAVGYGDDVVVGKRGFLPQEKEKGLVLVFNQKMNFTWDDIGITATLVFGSTPEKCFIPHDKIMTIFSPEMNAQFSIFPKEQTETDQPETPIVARRSSSDEKVIKVNFSKKKHK